MRLTSPAFAAGATIPTRFTCDGDDTSPPLAWDAVPDATRSLVLIVDDPDAPDPAAPRMTWVHWVLYNLPASLRAVPEGFDPGSVPGVVEGRNDFGRTAYGGPCPPVGRHRYFHRVYALDALLPDRGAVTRSALDLMMAGHILASAELMATCER